MSEIPLGSIDRLIRSKGVRRISMDTSKSLRDILENIGTEIIQNAIKLAESRNRSTITKEDIILAYKMIINQI